MKNIKKIILASLILCFGQMNNTQPWDGNKSISATVKYLAPKIASGVVAFGVSACCLYYIFPMALQHPNKLFALSIMLPAIISYTVTEQIALTLLAKSDGYIDGCPDCILEWEDDQKDYFKKYHPWLYKTFFAI